MCQTPLVQSSFGVVAPDKSLFPKVKNILRYVVVYMINENCKGS